MIKREFGKHFKSDGGALTLKAEEVCDNIRSFHWQELRNRVFSKKHDDGWVIKAKIKEDYYSWINEFEAEHPVLGKVWGDFENIVYATSKEAFDDFYKKHTPEAWDYANI